LSCCALIGVAMHLRLVSAAVVEEPKFIPFANIGRSRALAAAQQKPSFDPFVNLSATKFPLVNIFVHRIRQKHNHLIMRLCEEAGL